MQKGFIYNVPIWQFVATWVIAICAIIGLIISVKSCQQAQDASDIAEASIKPALEVWSFISYSNDMRADLDKDRIDRNKVAVIPIEDSDPSGNGRYAWLLIQNKGNGLAEIMSIEVHYELFGDKPMALHVEWDDQGRLISGGGEILAFPLGSFFGTLHFRDEVQVTYRTSLDEPTPLLLTFSPRNIYDYIEKSSTTTRREL